MQLVVHKFMILQLIFTHFLSISRNGYLNNKLIDLGVKLSHNKYPYWILISSPKSIPNSISNFSKNNNSSPHTHHSSEKTGHVLSGMDEFELICEAKIDGRLPVKKYRSKSTGLTVVLAGVPGPLVNGYFCLATEAHDDDGLPHTLEHLIFMGSEMCPYKGMLDFLANRCLAQGTNAWTDTDHTCYTVTTAGYKGFLNLLPIYLDHVLYPSLTESAYLTEVHHVNVEGEDAGVVYCEMQGRENTGSSRTMLELMRDMYPGHCGYKSETGGIMKNLRESTSNDKVRNYHSAFYRPDNLCLIVTGQVEPTDLFNILIQFIDKIHKKEYSSEFTRPWTSVVPELTTSVEREVTYPSDDQKNGMVNIGWRGPKAKEMYKMTAISVLMDYLMDTSVAPLMKQFIEREDPYCSKLKFSMVENQESCMIIKFDNVPVEKLTQIKPVLIATLTDIADPSTALDMRRLTTVIQRQILESLLILENQPHDTVAFHCIGDFLFGDDQQDLHDRINRVSQLKTLSDEQPEFWKNLLTSYLTVSPSVTIMGRPSHAVRDELAKADEDRVSERKLTLGEEGLRRLNDIIEQAIEDNEESPPEDMWSDMPVPSTSGIEFHSITQSSNRAVGQDECKLDIHTLPFTFQLDDISTNFVELHALIDTSDLSDELRLYLPLWTEVVFELPVMRDGVLIEYEEVINQLSADTLSTDSSVGMNGDRFSCGSYCQLVVINIKVQADKYNKGVQWLHDILYKTQFTSERLKMVATKVVNDVPKYKQKGNIVASALMTDMNFKKNSNMCVTNMIRQHQFLNDNIINKINDDKSSEVIEKMDTLREFLTDPNNMRIHMVTNVDKLISIDPNPLTIWRETFLPEKYKQIQKFEHSIPVSEYTLLSDNITQSEGNVIGVGSVESSFFIQVTPCITSFTHTDLPAITVFIEYLTALEGPMWRQIRGLGLAYSYSIRCDPSEGLLYFKLYKSTHPLEAYKQALEIIEGYISGKTPFLAPVLEAAISSVIFEIIERETTIWDASQQSIYSYFRGVGPTYNRDMLQKVSSVTIPDLERVGLEYFKSLFDVTKSRCAVCCHPSKTEEIRTGFEQIGRSLDIIPDMDNYFKQ